MLTDSSRLWRLLAAEDSAKYVVLRSVLVYLWFEFVTDAIILRIRCDERLKNIDGREYALKGCPVPEGNQEIFIKTTKAYFESSWFPATDSYCALVFTSQGGPDYGEYTVATNLFWDHRHLLSSCDTTACSSIPEDAVHGRRDPRGALLRRLARDSHRGEHGPVRRLGDLPLQQGDWGAYELVLVTVIEDCISVCTTKT